MFLNRFTINFSPNNPLVAENRFRFSRFADRLEELFFHFMGKKVNVGGHGFFSTKVFFTEDLQRRIEVTEYFETQVFEPISMAHQIIVWSDEAHINYLLDLIEEVLNAVELKIEIDRDKFDYAVRQLRSNWLIKVETEMKASRTHRSRKLKVLMVRVLELTEESIICRIIDNTGKVLRDIPVKPNSDIYNMAYDYKTSKWEDNSFIVFDRFDRETFRIDVSQELAELIG